VLAEDVSPPEWAGAYGWVAAQWEFDIEPPEPTNIVYNPPQDNVECFNEEDLSGNWNSAEGYADVVFDRIYIPRPEGIDGDTITFNIQVTWLGGIDEVESGEFNVAGEAWLDVADQYMGGNESMDVEYTDLGAGLYHAVYTGDLEPGGDDWGWVTVIFEYGEDVRITELVIDAVVHDGTIPPGTGERPGGPANPELAHRPQPANGDDYVLQDIELGWSPGVYAVTHNLYFGTDFDEVNEADTDSVLLVGPGLTDASYAPPSLLDWGQEYFWRIDEVNDVDPNSPWKGDVWSFTVEPYNFALDPEADQYQYNDYEVEPYASSVADDDTWADAVVWDGVEDGIQSTETWTMWLSDVEPDGMAWIVLPFDKAYQLAEMEIWNYNEDVEPDLGFGFKTTVIEYTTDELTADEVTWVELMTADLNPAPGEDTPATDTLDLQGTVATGLRLTAQSNQSGFNDQFGLSSVRIYYLPVRALEPVPEPGEVVDADDLVLEWRPGRGATEHKVYLGTDEEDLPLADTVSEPSYEPDVALDTEYFWRIDETDDPALAGAVWSFATNAFLTVDDMEDYEDSAEDATVAVWGTWADGIADQANGGSRVGDDFGATEKDITHDDSDQSMPLSYGNTGGVVISEAARTFDEAQDWTRSDVQALTFYVHGSEDNVDGQMYVKVNGVKYDEDNVGEVDLAEEDWQEVNINLAGVAAKGVDLQSVTSLTIGIEGAGSSGEVLIDNIRLYPTRCLEGTELEGDLNGDCIVDEEDLAIVADNFLARGLLVEYTFENGLQDSSGNGRHGLGVNGPTVQGGILTLDGTNFVDVPLGADNPFDGTQDFSIALDFMTVEPSVLFSSARDSTPDNHAMSIFVTHWDDPGWNGAALLDIFWMGGAGVEPEHEEGPLNGEWHTLVATYSAEEWNHLLYLDGVSDWGTELDWWPEEEGDIPFVPDIADDTVRIGGTLNEVYPVDEPANPLIGSIDNVRVFPFALSPDDIELLPDEVPGHPADVNGDGVVDQADEDIVEGNMGANALWP
jgi:hypothetical protein